MHTKFLLAAALALVGLTNIALAADLPAQTYTKAPVMPVAVFTWTGFYVGGSFGGGWSDQSTGIVTSGIFCTTGLGGCPSAGTSFGAAVPTQLGQQSGGPIGGLQAGYNFQWNRIVLGIEADFSETAISGSADARSGALLRR
jgi:outer membrane immunogenic protein